MPDRMTVDAENGSFLRLMPAIHNGSMIMGFKCMNLTPGAGVHYWIALIDLRDGKMIAQLDADYITTVRTSATAAIATKMLDICDGNINTREGIDLIDFSHFIFRARPLGNRLDKEICPI